VTKTMNEKNCMLQKQLLVFIVRGMMRDGASIWQSPKTLRFSFDRDIVSQIYVLLFSCCGPNDVDLRPNIWISRPMMS
jgi:hypothetical protein